MCPKYGRFAHLGLNAKTEKQIIQDYFEQFADYNDPNFLYTLNDFSIAGYGGTYNGNVVTVIYPDLMVRSQVYRPRPIWTYKSKKYVLLYADECMVWKQGQFWTFNDFNILYPFSDEELKSINKCLNPGCPF